MTKRYAPLAIAYDFDGTLSPHNMQEFDFIPKIGMSSREFWREVNSLAKENNADNILMYMMNMLDKAREAKVSARREEIKCYGDSVKLFPGVTDWFNRINEYGRNRGIKVKHYIISSGIREMIEGTPIAREFAEIYASTFVYDHDGVARWPALAINYTTKTQYLFRINKGVKEVYDNNRINAYVPKQERPVPFENMVFIGDGDTDIPCFRLVKDQGGHAIAVYKPKTKGAKQKAERLIHDGRVNFIVPANYEDGNEIDDIVKRIVDKIAADWHLRVLG